MAPPSPSFAPRRPAALALVMTGVLLSTMDSGMVNVALPTIMTAMAAGLDAAGLVVTVYLLTITATLVFWGRLADRFGRWATYRAGLLVFAVGAACCALSPGLNLLLFSRGIQGLGAAMMMATGPAIIRQAFPLGRLGRSIGMVGMATAGGLLTGPLVGGLLLAGFSWRAIFLLPVPLCLLAFLLGRLFHEDVDRHRVGEAAPFDWPGSCCWLLLVLLWVGTLQRLDSLATGTVFLLLLLFLTTLLLFLWLENRAVAPVLPLGLFARRYFSVAVGTAALSFAVLFAVLILIPFYLEYVLGQPVVVVGQVMMAVPVTLIFLAPWSGRLYDRIGARVLTSAGLAISALALGGLALLPTEGSLVRLVVLLALLGAGQSIFLTPNSASVLGRVDEQYLGVSAGILATARNFGMVSGAALALALFSFFLSSYGGGLSLSDFTAADRQVFLHALRATFAGMAGLAVVGALLSLCRPR
ncbi:MAG TPA: MFS transporter [Desulforhopalus sp.]|nr:MFS transporter [Desulforhopalus sp.]